MYKRLNTYLSVYYKAGITKSMSYSTLQNLSPIIVSNNALKYHTQIEDLSSSQMITPVSSVSSDRKLGKVAQALFDHVYGIDHYSCEPGEEDSFFVCDLDEIRRLYFNWCFRLPRVQPFYAIKCNTDPMILKTLADMGASFDCASKGEIETVLQLGVDPSKIIYANPCKSASFIRFAEQQNVNLTTFDNADELIKMKKFHPKSRLLLRIITDDENAQCRLSTKFGATMSNSYELLKLAKELNLDVAGIAFHVGSGSSDPTSMIKAIDDAKRLFKYGSTLGHNMDILDIGGGFVAETFETASEVVNQCLDSQFPPAQFPYLKIMAEPGRYMSSSAFTLACHVIARRSYVEPETGKLTTMVYLNDGIYGNLNCILYDHQTPMAKTLTHKNGFYYGADQDTDKEVSIWGPTCDGLDCISKSTMLKHTPEVGDWIYFENIGAYTMAASTPFNGFKQISEVKYV